MLVTWVLISISRGNNAMAFMSTPAIPPNTALDLETLPAKARRVPDNYNCRPVCYFLHFEHVRHSVYWPLCHTFQGLACYQVSLVF